MAEVAPDTPASEAQQSCLKRKVSVRLPRSTYEKVADTARLHGMSLNQAAAALIEDADPRKAAAASPTRQEQFRAQGADIVHDLLVVIESLYGDREPSASALLAANDELRSMRFSRRYGAVALESLPVRAVRGGYLAPAWPIMLWREGSWTPTSPEAAQGRVGEARAAAQGPRGELVKVQAYLDRNMFEAIEARAAEEGLSVSRCIRDLLEEADVEQAVRNGADDRQMLLNLARDMLLIIDSLYGDYGDGGAGVGDLMALNAALGLVRFEIVGRTLCLYPRWESSGKPVMMWAVAGDAAQDAGEEGVAQDAGAGAGEEPAAG